MTEKPDSFELLRLTSQIISAHVSHNTVDAADLPDLILRVYGALNGTENAAENAAEAARKPAVPIKRSVQPDYIVCLEDGRKLKMLKRHLRTAYNLSPEDYRRRWGLPADYPMVAPTYAKRRSKLAKQIGLGRRP